MRVLAVLPTYNENTKLVQDLVLRINKLGVDVLIVNDGAYFDIIGAKVIHNSKRMGRGSSLKQGFDFAINNQYDWVFMCDADGEHEPKDIPRFIEKANQGYDIILGQRKIKRSFSRTFLNKFSSFWLRFILSEEITDTQCGFRLMRTCILKKCTLKSTHFEFDLELLLELIKLDAKMCTINITHSPINNSSVTLKDYLKINNLFDRWYLENSSKLKIPLYTRLLLHFFCRLGLLVGAPLEKWL